MSDLKSRKTLPPHSLILTSACSNSAAISVLDEALVGEDEQLMDPNGRAAAWPVALAGDKGYRADWIDAYLLALGIEPVTPSKENANCDSRSVVFDREAYREPNLIERLIGWLKECRRILSRFEKGAKNFGGMIKMAFIQRYLRLLAS